MKDLSKLLKIISLVLALTLLLPLASCGESGEMETGDESIEFDPIPAMSPYDYQYFELTDVLSYFSKKEGEKYCVSSEHFGVTPVCLTALFNYILECQLTPGDGRYDEFDAYFETGELSKDVSIRNQNIPGREDLTWYSLVQSEALSVCFDVLWYFEYASEKQVSPISRINEGKIEALFKGIEERGKFEEFYGEGADPSAVRAALAIYIIADDPSAFTAYDDLYEFQRPEYTVESSLSLTVAPALAP